MKIIYYGLTFLILTFSLFFVANFLLFITNGGEVTNNGDVHNSIIAGLRHIVLLLCVISSIIIIFLYKILEEFKKINSKNEQSL